MPDYGRIFGKDVALGLGLGPVPRPDPEEVARAYREDPASAFSRAAAFAQPPGDAVPIPFASVVTLVDGSIPDPSAEK